MATAPPDDFTARMQGAKDLHRARGTTGGAPKSTRQVGANELRARDQGKTVDELIRGDLQRTWNVAMRELADTKRKDDQPILAKGESIHDWEF
jgi:hypothetical protein